MPTPDPPPPRAAPPPGAPPPPGPEPRWQTVDVAQRLGNTVKTLLSLHVDIAREEAERDLKRVAAVVALLGGCASLGAAIVLNLAVLLVLAVQRLTGLPALESVAIGLGLYLCILAALVTTITLLLRGPFLPRTRALLQRTFASITQDDPDLPPAAGA